MRQITIRYQGECKKCGSSLEVGQSAMYETSMGCFCIGCEPTDVEDIRAFRLAKAERKAEKYEEWAEKREHKANAQLNSYPEIRHDWAFITQPGHIPFRARMNEADNRAIDSLKTAEKFRDKADSLRHVRVAGDAERRRQKTRDALDSLIKKGDRVQDCIYGNGTVIGVYKVSYRIQFDRGFIYARDKSYVLPIRLGNDANA